MIVHEAEEGGYWAEVPAILGCATQGETYDEVLSHVSEAIDACLSIDIEQIELSETDKILELVV